MYVTFTSALIVEIHATVALEAACRTAKETNCCVKRNSLASRTDHSLVLVEIEVVKDKRKMCEAIWQWIFEHDAAVKLGGCL